MNRWVGRRGEGARTPGVAHARAPLCAQGSEEQLGSDMAGLPPLRAVNTGGR